MATGNRPGRPRIVGERCIESLTVAMTPTLYELVTHEALASGAPSVSAWARETLLARIRKERGIKMHRPEAAGGAAPAVLIGGGTRAPSSVQDTI